MRVQVFEGGYQGWSGLADYDTDHHGVWAAGIVDVETDLAELANDLLRELEDGLAMEESI